MAFCKYCGAQLNGNDPFCPKCGKTVVPENVGANAGANNANRNPNAGMNPNMGATPNMAMPPKKKANPAAWIIPVATALVVGIGLAVFFLVIKPSRDAKADIPQIRATTEASTEQAVPATTEAVSEAQSVAKVTTIEKGEHVSSGNGYSTTFIGKDDKGNVIWINASGELPSTELENSLVIGINDGIGYYYADGLVAVDPQTGTVLWEESVGGSPIFAFDSEKNIYICGYDDSEARKIDQYGKVVATYPLDGAYWPYSIYVIGDEVMLSLMGPTDMSIIYDAETGVKKTTFASMFVVGCEENISLRVAPDKAAERITYIPLYSEVEFIEDGGNGFYKIRYNGVEGYSLAEYLGHMQPRYDTTTKTVVKCNEFITLRTGPETSCAEITKIPLGTEIGYIQDARNGFALVDYCGQCGYVLKEYLQ